MSTHSWSEEYARKVLEGYRFFMDCKKITKDYDVAMQLVPSPCVDNMWKEHISDTVSYAADCELIAGAFVHRDASNLVEVSRIEAMKNLIRTYYGENYDKEIWKWDESLLLGVVARRTITRSPRKRNRAADATSAAASPAVSSSRLRDTSKDVTLSIRNETNETIFFRVSPRIKLHQMFTIYARKLGHTTDDFMFIFEGRELSGEETYESCEMKDGDAVHACRLSS
jgi:hypothetical protein